MRLPALQQRTLCHAAMESGRLTMNAIVTDLGEGLIEVSPLNSREIHSTTFFNGIALILPVDWDDASIPASIHASGCSGFIQGIAPSIPSSPRRKIRLIPFS